MGWPKKWAAKRLRALAPRTFRNLESMSRINAEYELDGKRMIVYERELREMRREIDALRREHRRVIELYDAVFDYVRDGGSERASKTSPDHVTRTS